MRSILTICIFCAVALLVSGCNETARVNKTGKLTVVTTTGMIADAVRNVAGEKAEVIALMGSGVDPHLYKASHGDLEKITSADVIFYNGLHLEGKMGSVLEKAGRTRTVIAVSKDIPPSLLRNVPGFEDVRDPHIWFDVKLWQYAVNTISKTLQEKDTINASLYEANSRRYNLLLDSLHEAIKLRISTIPPAQRVLITAHDAFGYFGDAYGIKVRGLQGISTISEFGLRDVTDLVNFIIERKIKAIFIETSVSDRSINAVLEGCEQRGWKVVVGGSLFSDAMGDEKTPEGTYIGMVSANVNTIINSLK